MAKRNHFPIQGERVFQPQEDRNQWLANSSSFLSEEPLLLNPEIDDPEEHLSFYPDGRIYALDGNQRGRATIDILDLNRDSLVVERREKIKDSQSLLGIILVFSKLKEKLSPEDVASSRPMLASIFEKIIQQTLPDQQFSLLGRVMVENFRTFFIEEKLEGSIANWIEEEFSHFREENEEKIIKESNQNGRSIL